MHHSESTWDSPGTKKMAHASAFTSRSGSNTLSGGTSSLLNADNMNCNSIPTDDHQPSVLLHTQSQSHQSAGAQIKKKSGFQITSVLPAQFSASTNNSIAEDTESYDDIDESHTEDLSYSDILDVSVSRATDTGIPERSSSEETLNSLHGGETPGVVSPNEAVNPHHHSGQTGYMVNGTVLNHQPPEHHKDQGVASMAMSQPIQEVPVCFASINSGAPSGDTIVQSAAPAQSRIQISSSFQAADVDISATVIVNETLFSGSGSATCVSGLGIPRGVIVSNGFGTSFLGRVEPVDNTMTTITGSQPLPASNTTQVQASTTIASRFRVVKLDSMEPFRKGRWMCTEFSEKEASTAAPFTDVTPTYRAADGFIHSESDSKSEGSCTLMSGAGGKRTQPTQTFVQPAVPVQSALSQTSAQRQIHSQDTGIHTPAIPSVAPPDNMQVPGTDCQPPSSRIQEQVPYIIEGHTGQLQSGYPVNQQPSMLITQGLQSVDYAPISQVIQTPAQPHEMPSVQSTITPKATPGSVQTVPQSVSPRPQVAVPHMLMAQQNIRSKVQQPQIPEEQQQQTIVNQPSQPKSSATGQTAPSITSFFLKSNIQSIIPPALPNGALIGGQSSGLELTLLQQEGPSTQLSLVKGPYSGVKPVPASKLEDAGRLLLQHQSLFSLPQLARGSVSGLSGQCNSEGSGDASAFITSTGIDEDSFSGASVVAIDNKIEQAMDLVKSHLMYAVREEVEVLKEQIKELIERNSQLEQENHLLKNLASPEQLAQFQAQVQSTFPILGNQTGTVGGLPTSQTPGWGPPV